MGYRLLNRQGGEGGQQRQRPSEQIPDADDTDEDKGCVTRWRRRTVRQSAENPDQMIGRHASGEAREKAKNAQAAWRHAPSSSKNLGNTGAGAGSFAPEISA